MTNKLLPLEYCRIGRAARLLKCEVEDILHWASLGMIEACVFLSGDEVRQTFYRATGDVDWHVDPMEAHKELFKADGNAYPLIGRYSESTRYWDEGIVYAKGPWVMGVSHVADIVAGKPLPLAGLPLWPAGGTKAGGLSMGVKIPVSDVMIDEGQIWVVWDDLDRMNSAISGKGRLAPLPHLTQRRMAEDAAAAESNVPHGNTKVNDAKRYAVLLAAGRAMEKWPSELPKGTAVGLAEVVENHAMELFGADTAPYSIDGMARLISAAMKAEKTPDTP